MYGGIDVNELTIKYNELSAMPDKIPFYEKFGFSANEEQRLKIMCHVK